MSVEDELTTFVTADSAVATLIANRMYPVVAPAEDQGGTAPYIVYRRLGTARLGTMGGPGSAKVRFRLTCWAVTYDGATALADAVRARLDGQSGAWGGLTVQHCTVEDESDAFEPSPELLDRQFLGRQLDVEIMHAE